MFINFEGKGYGDSCKYIAEELLKKENIDLVWSVKTKYDDMPKNIRQVKYFSFKWIYEMVTAKCWVNNSRFPCFVRKRQNQYYIQVWHGGLALKKIEFDANYLPKKYVINMLNDNKMIDLMISNSGFCTNMYRKSFKYNGQILEIGTPRNDSLINDEKNLKSKALLNLNYNEKDKYLLYAPTFRENYDNNPYDINFLKLKNLLEEKYKCSWKILIKLHPNVKSSEIKFNYDEGIIDVSDYSDIQELICLSDLLITDYSSTMFEAMIINKPVVLYANDIENYNRERGTYFTFDELPFFLTKNNDELLKIINKLDLLEFTKDYSKFKERLKLKEMGLASKKVSEKIIKYLIRSR